MNPVKEILSDTGGHTSLVLTLGSRTLSILTRSKEVLMRWMELSAFTPVYRTHEGNRPEESVQFYEDEETLRHFARFANLRPQPLQGRARRLLSPARAWGVVCIGAGEGGAFELDVGSVG